MIAATGFGWRGPKKVTADGATGKAALPPGPPAEEGFDLAAAAPLQGQEEAGPGPEVGEKVKVGSDGGSVTVAAVEDNVIAGRLFGAGEGMKYIAVEVKGCSGPNEKNLSLQPSYFLLRLDDGTVHDPGPGAKKPSLEGGKMLPGKCLSGWVTYMVKEGSLATAVIYDGSSRLTWTVPLPKGAKPTTTTTLRAGAATAASSTTSTTARRRRPLEHHHDHQKEGDACKSRARRPRSRRRRHRRRDRGLNDQHERPGQDRRVRPRRPGATVVTAPTDRDG